MRAVYQSTQKYLSLSYNEVNYYAPAMSDGDYDKQGRYIPPKVVGSTILFPLKYERKCYAFIEGEDHNQLTLAEPTEICNMREYIKRRGKDDDLIREIIFEGNEAELEEVVPVIEEKEPVKEAEIDPPENDELSDWDRKLLANMNKR